ncbi:Tudor domain-containing protein 3 [Zea mays]|uniref:Tudor domain-containing protein 3 n=1 Tax=Zea mays TaxID=4577 RepID=A0A3L6DNZ9_MAIZE|nr:Tudor domain-containing protein 3 [Zea mays]
MASAAAEAPGASASSAENRLLQSLAERGWRFRDPTDEAIQALLLASPTPSPEAVESELVSMDLRMFGGKCLPDRTAAGGTSKRLSYLHGPVVLQIVSLRDIYHSSIDASFKNPQQRRLLRFGLTDGICEAVAIEFSPIPFITEEIAPGTKIRLENKVPINNGILCLSAKNVTVIGGTVQSLYEEWQMNQKYSGLSRPSLRLSPSDDGVGPPPFEKLDIEARPCRETKVQAYPDVFMTCDLSSFYKARKLAVNSGGKPMNEDSNDENRDNIESKVESKQITQDSRPKEVSEAVPVQNQAAAQKLLQKMSQAVPEDRRGRGHRFKGKGKEEDAQVFTLDEWEKRKAIGSKPAAESYVHDTSRDEELARQLQEQLDLEDLHGGAGAGVLHGGAESSDAERLRMSMFSFSGPDEAGGGRRDFRGRGRGRGGGRRRGRGRF